MREYDKDLVGKTFNMTGTIIKSNVKRGTQDIKICINNIRIIGTDTIIIDHAWVPMEKFTDKIINGNTITFTAKITKRKRAPQSIYDAPVEDITLTKIRQG